MDEDKVVYQPAATKDAIFNTFLEISQQYALAIQNLENYMAIINRNTLIYYHINGKD